MRAVISGLRAIAVLSTLGAMISPGWANPPGHPPVHHSPADVPNVDHHIHVPVPPVPSPDIAPRQSQESSRGPQLSTGGETVNELRLGMAPAYLVGDVDEDGTIGPEDAVLVQGLIGVQSDRLRSVSCAAAADVDMNGLITLKDHELLKLMIRDGPRRNGVLYDQSTLPCSHSRSFIAFSQRPACDGPLLVHFLGKSAARFVSWDGGALRQRNGWREFEIGYESRTLKQGTRSILLSLGGVSFVYWLSSFCAIEGGDEQDETDWGKVPHDDPRDENRPQTWGEEIDDVARCPQIDKGCEALIVDFLGTSELWQEPDATATKSALEGIGCHVEYAAPRFVKIPPRPPIQGGTAPMGGSFSNGQYEAVRRQIGEYDALLADVLRRNTEAWTEIQAKIRVHRNRVKQGASLAYQLVNAHGSESSGGSCGQWGTGYDTGTGTLTRDSFHTVNYRAMHGNVCTAVTEDRSCYSGLTASAVDFLNNLAVSNCSGKPHVNHGFHAAYDADMAIASSSSTSTCTMLTLTKQDYDIADLINKAGKDDGYRALAKAFDTKGVNDEASGKYMDTGYKRVPMRCSGHIKSY